jgi:hypothetical protein
MYSQVFVLTTGRSGSTTLYLALSASRNYTVGHESSKTKGLGHARFVYPAGHIEVDNRLVWFLPILSGMYPGGSTLWVHLVREREACVASIMKTQILRQAYPILLQQRAKLPVFAEDYYETVNALIQSFLADRDEVAYLELGDDSGFKALWERIEAEGDLERALGIWRKVHNEWPGRKRGGCEGLG